MRVWVTRDEPPGGPLGRALVAEGLGALHEPVVERRRVSDAGAEIAALGPDDWLVLTSAFTLQCIALPPARVARVAVAGPATAEAARRAGLRVELVAERGGAAALYEQLRAHASRGRICAPRSRLAHPPAPWPGVTITSPVAYETRARAFDRRVIDRAGVAAVTSPSAAAALAGVRLPLASIGPTTSDAIRRLGLVPWAEASDPTFTALARVIAERIGLT